jgi:hypothetical protein
MKNKNIIFIIFFLTQFYIIYSQTIYLQTNIRLSRKKFSNLIFGVNFADETMLNSVSYTINRRGGNSETRYNWEYGISNKASDWFFFNIADTLLSGTTLPVF